VAKNRGADRPGNEAYVEDDVGLQGPDQWIRIREKQFREDQPGDGAVEQEVVPLDRGADRAGDQCSPQLPTVLQV
jgi:hypothetical protein